MALTVFDPSIRPSPGTSVAPQVKILAADFGDGYSQPTPDGINHIKKKLSLSWTGLSESQKDEIDGFLTDRKGTEPFWYQPVGHSEALKWICSEWEVSIDGVWRITATFIQTFTNQI